MLTNEKHEQAPCKKDKQTPVKKGKKSNAVSHDLMLQTNTDMSVAINTTNRQAAMTAASFCSASTVSGETSVPNSPYGSSVGRVDKIRASMTGSGASAGSVSSARSAVSAMQVRLLVAC